MCTLDGESFMEVFNIGGAITKIIKYYKINETFKRQKSFFTGKVMQRHIPNSRKEKGDLPKIVGYLMPMEFSISIFSILSLEWTR